MRPSTFTWAVSCLLLLVTSSLSPLRAQEDDEKAAKKKAQAASRALLAEGQRELQIEKYAAAAEKFQEAVDSDPENATAWQLLGFALHSDGKLDQAITAHLKATEFASTKQLGFYNLGCAYSMKNELDKAIEYLDKSTEGGFGQWKLFEEDPDLENVRKDPRFAKVAAKAKNGGRAPIETKDLEGEWTIRSGKRSGDNVPEERLGTVTFEKDKLTIPAGPNDKFVMSYTLKESSQVTFIDVKIESGPAPEGTAKGILKLTDGKLTLCYDPHGEERPTSFESTSGNGYFLFVMEKKTKE